MKYLVKGDRVHAHARCRSVLIIRRDRDIDIGTYQDHRSTRAAHGPSTQTFWQDVKIGRRVRRGAKEDGGLEDDSVARARLKSCG